MSAMEKAMVLVLVKTSNTSKSQTLAEIGIPRRTYYNWVRQEKTGGKKSVQRRPWNRIKEEEGQMVVDHARASQTIEGKLEIVVL